MHISIFIYLYKYILKKILKTAQKQIKFLKKYNLIKLNTQGKFTTPIIEVERFIN